MTQKQHKELGAALHQLCNYTAFYGFYLRCWLDYSNHKEVNHILRQSHSNMTTTIDKVARAINQPELKDFVKSQLENEDRLADLMAILELCSRMDASSIEKIRKSLENQLLPILEGENEKD